MLKDMVVKKTGRNYFIIAAFAGYMIMGFWPIKYYIYVFGGGLNNSKFDFHK